VPNFSSKITEVYWAQRGLSLWITVKRDGTDWSEEGAGRHVCLALRGPAISMPKDELVVIRFFHAGLNQPKQIARVECEGLG
jgi:hypothetical protein